MNSNSNHVFISLSPYFTDMSLKAIHLIFSYQFFHNPMQAQYCAKLFSQRNKFQANQNLRYCQYSMPLSTQESIGTNFTPQKTSKGFKMFKRYSVFQNTIFYCINLIKLIPQIQKFQIKNTQQSFILQMSCLNQIFDVIQEFHDQHEEKTKKQEEILKREQLTSYQTLSSLPNTKEENSSSDDENEDEDDCGSKTKRIRKNRQKKLDEKSKWTFQDEIKYWKFFIHYKITHPYFQISWIQWKCDSIYKSMSKFVGKKPSQCKSKDQNMKKKHFDNINGLDVLDIAVIKLVSLKGKDEEICGLLNRYQQLSGKDSSHMILLDERLVKMRENECRLNLLMGMFDGCPNFKDSFDNEMFL